MTQHARSRSRERESVRVKREPRDSRSRERRERRDGVRVKEESTSPGRTYIKREPIYIDERGRPFRKDAAQAHPRDGHSGAPEPQGASRTTQEVEKPNFEPSGLLAAETNSRNGVALKYTVPPESRMPTLSWRLYVFKPDDREPKKMNVLKTIHIDANEHYLFGCDRRVADVEIFHPTISKQHAVIQHRLVANNRVVPYVIDLESTNGTFLNDERLEPRRYYELRERDVVKFGLSTREYVVLNDKSA